jgi:hypothetical protein
MHKKCVLTLFTAVLLGPSIMNAQATRTWISGVGDDNNPCSRTAPCKTWAGAIAKTQAGGEINALDPGGFGAVTITKAITLDGGPGIAGVLVSGTNGIVVSAGASDVVSLRNLDIDGLGTGLAGIVFNSGKALHVENCTIYGFTGHGIDISSSTGNQTFVLDSRLRDNAGSGIHAKGTVTKLFVTIDKSRFENNTVNGVFGEDFTRWTIRDSDSSGNAGSGFVATANNGDVIMNVTNSTTSSNGNAGVVAGGGTNLSEVRISSVSIVSNQVSGLVASTNGQIISFGNNYNAGTGAPTSTITVQ